MDSLIPITSIQDFQPIDSVAQERAHPDKKSSVKTPASKVSTGKFIEKLQAVLSSTDISVGFAKYGNNKTAVIVYNKETGKVIREIPPKEIQQLQFRLEEMIGMIFNHTA